MEDKSERLEFFKVVFDNGKPFEEIVSNQTDLKRVLKDFFISNKNQEGAYFDAFVFDKNGEDITDSQFIGEMISDIDEEIEEETENKINEEFEEILRDKLTDKQFYEWVSEWYDLEGIMETALSWDTALKKETIEELKQRFNL